MKTIFIEDYELERLVEEINLAAACMLAEQAEEVARHRCTLASRSRNRQQSKVQQRTLSPWTRRGLSSTSSQSFNSILHNLGRDIATR
jgi:hypothetical protein